MTLDQNNFCGMGVTSNGMKGNSFATPQLGIRAQIQHLKAYANTAALNGECVDPRFSYVTRGCAEYVEWLGQKENPNGKGWATGAGYGEKILSILAAILATAEPKTETEENEMLEVKELFTVNEDTAPLAPSTIHSYHRTISSILERAVKWKCIPSNPAERAELPSLAGHKARYLDEPEAKQMLQLLQAEPIKWRAPIIFDLLSGLRRAELLGLRWQDVNLDDGVVHIVQTSNYVSGKGVYISTPKTEDSDRYLRVSRAAVMILLEYKRWQDEMREKVGDAWEGTPEDDRIFTNEVGRPMFPTSITQWMGKFIKRTGLPPACVHSLRHTYASLLIAEGTPLVVVSSNLGHAQTSTTSDIYSHVIASAEAQAAQVLDKFSDDIHPKFTPNEEKAGVS